MVYAIKAIDGIEFNKVVFSWEECKPLVWGKKAVYKSCLSTEEAAEFIEKAPVTMTENRSGSIPTDFTAKQLKLTFMFTRFRKENGAMISVYETSEKERVTCIGYFLPENKRLTYQMNGIYTYHETYGYQFEVESFSESIPISQNGIIDYLRYSNIKGIGKIKAERIYATFGEESLNVLEKEPDRLLQVKGITVTILNQIKKSYQEIKCARELTTFLLKYGISNKFASIIYAQHENLSCIRIKENPYLLCKIKGLTFLDADNIAKGENCVLDKRERIVAATDYILAENEVYGSTGMELDVFNKKLIELLSPISAQKVSSIFIDLIKEKQVRLVKLPHNGQIKRVLFRASMYEREETMAKKIVSLSEQVNVINLNIKKYIAQIEKVIGMNYDHQQKEASITALSSSIMVLTGDPGTGKTATIKLISLLYKELFPENEVVFMAPTGRAARKIAEATEEQANTIHSVLQLYEDSNYEDDEASFTNSLIVIDEFSMVDTYVASALFKSIKDGCKVIIVGDVDQLASVNAGAVLRDIMESGVVPIVALDKIYRQNEESEICENARKIKKGQTNLTFGKGFTWHETSSMENIKNTMLQIYKERVAEFGIENVMLLCPYKEKTAGVYDLNKTIQEDINPWKPGIVEVEHRNNFFRINDLVMQLKNVTGVSNGDIGRIKDINNVNNEYIITIVFNDVEYDYNKDRFDELTLAYAYTVHKAQGSQAKSVIMCLASFHRGMLYRDIPLVGISRGMQKVDCVGEQSALTQAIGNSRVNIRITALGHLIKYEGRQFVVA